MKPGSGLKSCQRVVTAPNNGRTHIEKVFQSATVQYMETDTSFELLKEEYSLLEQTIDSLDTKSLTIKTWSVTLSMTGIGLAFINNNKSLLLLAGASALLFWLIEYYWKSFQEAHFKRIKELELFFAGKYTDITPMQIHQSWYTAYTSLTIRDIFRIASYSNVCMPHVAVFAAGMILFLIDAV